MAVFMFAYGYVRSWLFPAHGYFSLPLWEKSIRQKNQRFYMMQLAGHITDLDPDM
jgi:hypothetical protein